MQCKFVGLRIEHVIGGEVQRRYREFAGGLVSGPFFQHLMPQQRRKQEAGRNRLAGLDALVGAVERQRDEFFTERLLEHDVEQGQQAVMQAFLAQLLQAGQRASAHEQLEHFIEHARSRHVIDQRRHDLDRRARGRVDREARFCGKAHYAQQAHRIFAKARFRHADDAQGLAADIGHAAVIIEHDLAGRIVIHGIDGEVATDRIFMLFAESIVAQDAAVFILWRRFRRCAAEGRHFELLLAHHHMYDLEAFADDERAPEQALDLLGRGIRGNVEILGLVSEQQVSHGAADDERLETGFLQRVRHAHRIRRQQRRINLVLGLAERDRRARVPRFVFHAEHAADELFNH